MAGKRQITQPQAREILWKLNQLRTDVRTIADAIRTRENAYKDPDAIADMLLMILDGSDPYSGNLALD